MANFPATDGPARRSLEALLLVFSIVALAFNLRAAITSLPPVFPELQDKLHLSSADITWLAPSPVLSLGVFSGIAASLSRRFGEERVLFGALIGCSAGLLLRGAFPGALLFPGSILALGSIAIMNVLLSSMIKRRCPERAGLLIGVYLTALSSGAVIASLVSVPLFNGSGGSVEETLGLWGLPAAGGPPRGGGHAALDPPAPRPAARPPSGRGSRTAAQGRRPGRRVPAPAGLAGHRVHGPAEPALLRGRLMAAGVVPRPGRQRDHRGRAAGRDGPRQPAHLAGHPGHRPARGRPAAAGRAVGADHRGRPGRFAVGPAQLGRVLGADPGHGPGRRPRAGHLLHHGPGPGPGHRRVAVLAGPVGRLPALGGRPAGGGVPALGHRQLDRPGRAAARALRRRDRRGAVRRAVPRQPRPVQPRARPG